MKKRASKQPLSNAQQAILGRMQLHNAELRVDGILSARAYNQSGFTLCRWR
jgi:hypothetical protein